ncbi:MAG: hypothetical protein OEX77_01655 [Candidatus Bathyarchaeota archaeon]|nr:hypothetical protein [Candidatus Bathyarchaeota archaeon]MDH5733141.1 hypothetical protein [Candidatus Bathyarchaeota archaeon]
MVELKPTDGTFLLGPLVIFISVFFMIEVQTTDIIVFMQMIQTNITAVTVLALGVILLSIGIAEHSPNVRGGVFMLLEGTGLFSAILGFFFYGVSMVRESVGGVYTITFSPLHFWVGLIIWTIGIFLITYAGISSRKKEEGLVFLNALLTLVLACFFVWEIFLK